MRDQYLLRLNNLNDISTTSYSLPDGFEIVEEVTLTANQNKSEMLKKRMSWTIETEENPKYKFSHKDLLESA